jgi:hypothetical protein
VSLVQGDLAIKGFLDVMTPEAGQHAQAVRLVVVVVNDENPGSSPAAVLRWHHCWRHPKWKG